MNSSFKSLLNSLTADAGVFILLLGIISWLYLERGAGSLKIVLHYSPYVFMFVGLCYAVRFMVSGDSSTRSLSIRMGLIAFALCIVTTLITMLI